jgi:hypothetical protein
VPGLLRDLLHDDDRRTTAIEALHQTIVHQDTIYEATPAAVPFLVEILSAPETPRRNEVAFLIATLADGHGYYEVHAPHLGEHAVREHLAKKGTTLEEVLAHEAQIVADVRCAVAAAIDLLAPLLHDRNISAGSFYDEPAARSMLRAAVARAVGHCAAPNTARVALLREVLTSESDEDVREALREAVDELISRGAPSGG